MGEEPEESEEEEGEEGNIKAKYAVKLCRANSCQFIMSSHHSKTDLIMQDASAKCKCNSRSKN